MKKRGRGRPNKGAQTLYNEIYTTYENNAKNATKPKPFNLTKEQVIELIHKPCAICGRKWSLVKENQFARIEYNSIDRIDSDKGYSIDNVQTLCETHNRSKTDLSEEKYNTASVETFYHVRDKEIGDGTLGALDKLTLGQIDKYRLRDT